MLKLAKPLHRDNSGHNYQSQNIKIGAAMSAPIVMQPFFHAAMLAMFAKEDAPISDKEHLFIFHLLNKRYQDFASSETMESLLFSAYEEKLSCRYFARRLVNLIPHQPRILEEFLDDLMALSLCDAPLAGSELEALRDISDCFGFSRTRFHQQLRHHTLPGYHDPYKLLGVDENVTEENLKQNYRQAVKSCHPDNWPSKSISEEMSMIFRDQFQALNNAYEMIKTKKNFR
jgi:DnaJ like chaperone protein